MSEINVTRAKYTDIKAQQTFIDREAPSFHIADYMTDEALFISEPVMDGGLVLGYQNKPIITKDMFKMCYEKWILSD